MHGGRYQSKIQVQGSNVCSPQCYLCLGMNTMNKLVWQRSADGKQWQTKCGAWLIAHTAHGWTVVDRLGNTLQTWKKLTNAKCSCEGWEVMVAKRATTATTAIE